MFLGEPPSTQADLHFRLFGFPIRVHPFFWLVTLVLGLGGDVADPINTLIWVAVVFVSILVHELGHAFLQRYYGGEPRITLYSFGGLASCDDCDRSPRAQILISLAGPLAGFLLAGLVIAVLAVTGHLRGFEASLIPVDWVPFDLRYLQQYEKLSPRDTLIWDLLQVNILWGLMNLLPIYPLDGGRIARELFTLNNARSGIIQSLQLSIGVAALVAVYALAANRDVYLCILFVLLAYGNFQTLQNYRGSWR
ncbi:MAG TPA: site-2 protease family protein [Lacipirellulaceae bacterium]|nr:site-2 protease family protein [Lacipirellulaceae bacterium]